MPSAIFLDRDGTLIVDKDYLHTPEEVEFFPGALEALARAAAAGFELIMVTNQSGVGRGYFTIEDVHHVHRHIEAECQKHAVAFRAIYIAPEHPDAPSRGRKPSAAFLFDARDEFGIDLASSYMIGDKLIDLECGWNARVRRSLLVRTGYGSKVEKKSRPAELKDAIVVNDICQAVNWVLEDSPRCK